MPVKFSHQLRRDSAVTPLRKTTNTSANWIGEHIESVFWDNSTDLYLVILKGSGPKKISWGYLAILLTWTSDEVL